MMVSSFVTKRQREAAERERMGEKERYHNLKEILNLWLVSNFITLMQTKLISKLSIR